MEKGKTWINRLVNILIIIGMGNVVLLTKLHGLLWLVVAVSVLYILILIIPSFQNFRIPSNRLRICGNGCELLILFSITTTMNVVWSIIGFCGVLPVGSVVSATKLWILNSLVIFLVELTVFWDGIIRVYITSEQLGIRYRIIGLACGWIPVAHLFALYKIIQVVSAEVSVETERLILDAARKDAQICKTRYPVLMVHGVFFRDFRYMNYWGRIPKELEKNGATIYYGNQQSAASVERCGQELAERIKEIVEETGCDKVNIIAHSKGGLDSRFALTLPGISEHVASLTTINTPHRGCEFADYLLEKLPKAQQDLLANTYNAALVKVGDPSPDFMEAVTDLTASACRQRNEVVKDMPGVFYQSIGSKLNVASGGRFPLNFSHHLVKRFDGANDGLVGEKSFPWGERFQFLTVKGKRGISHGDMIDLNRENFDGFDVREFFVQVVADLKQRGM